MTIYPALNTLFDGCCGYEAAPVYAGLSCVSPLFIGGDLSAEILLRFAVSGFLQVCKNLSESPDTGLF